MVKGNLRIPRVIYLAKYFDYQGNFPYNLYESRVCRSA